MASGYRYHVVSLTAVFLALAIGIIIGSSYVQSRVIEQQTRALDSLRSKFDKEIVSRRDQSKNYAAFATALVPILVHGRLTGKTVALVQTGDYPDALSTCRDALEQAGAKIINTTVIDKDFTARSVKTLADIMPKLLQTHPSLTSDAAAILKLIAATISKGGSSEEMRLLNNSRLLAMDGDYSKRCDVVVIVGGTSIENESRTESVDVPLITQLKTFGSMIAAVEPELAGVSSIGLLHNLEITTIDNVDTDIGRIALVLALQSDRGNYGVKPTATSGIIPPTPVHDDIRRNPGL